MKKNYKKLTMIVLMLTLVMVLSGCGSKNTPEGTVDELFKATKNLDFDKIQTLVAEDAKTELEETSEDLTDSYDLDNIDYKKVEGFKEAKTNLKKIMSDLSYKVTDVRKTDDVAIIEVEAEFVDGEKIAADSIAAIFGEIMGQAFSGGDELTEEESMSIVTKHFNKNYDVFEKKLKTDTVEIHLTKNEDNKWIITELKEDLLNVLAFNMLEGLDSSFSGLFNGF